MVLDFSGGIFVAIYAYGQPYNYGQTNTKNVKFIYNSLINEGISRFLYSWYDDCDLRRLEKLRYYQMTADEQATWDHAHKLLQFKIGDWVCHINVPAYNKVTVAQITSEYFYQANLPPNANDGRHCFNVDTVTTFDRNDKRVHNLISRRLKLQGSLWQIDEEAEFFATLAELKNSTTLESPFFKREIQPTVDEITKRVDDVPESELLEILNEQFKNSAFVFNPPFNRNKDTLAPQIFDKEIVTQFKAMLKTRNKKCLKIITTENYDEPLKNKMKANCLMNGILAEIEFIKIIPMEIILRNTPDIIPDNILDEITKIIQKNFPAKLLENFLAQIFRKIPKITNVKENGIRWGGDFGADLILSYSNGIKGVVQIKSYVGEHWETNAVTQLETAIEKYNADKGILMTTGTKTPNLMQAFDNLDTKMSQRKIKLTLISGKDFAKFIIKHGYDILFKNQKSS